MSDPKKIPLLEGQREDYPPVPANIDPTQASPRIPIEMSPAVGILESGSLKSALGHTSSSVQGDLETGKQMEKVTDFEIEKIAP